MLRAVGTQVLRYSTRSHAALLALLLAVAAPIACDEGGGGGDADADGDADGDGDADLDLQEQEDGNGNGDGDDHGYGHGYEDGYDGEAEAEGEGSGYPPAREALVPLDGQMLFPVHLDGGAETYHLVVDTGAGRTALDETLLREVQNGVGKASIDFGDGLVFPDYEVLAADLSAAEDHIGVPIHGLIGQDLFAALWFGLDYRAAEAYAAGQRPESPPPGLDPLLAVDLPYSLEQMLPVLDAEVSGAAVRLIADTGSGVTLVTESHVAPEVLQQGITGYVWYTSYGSDPATLVRLPALTIGGYTVENSWAAVVPDEFHLKSVLDLLGVEADGFLGYPVYRRFFVEVLGADERYAFHPYPDGSHLPAFEWDRVGLELMREDGAVVVDMVFAPSDASDQGIVPGDVLTAIDGQPLDGLPLDAIRRMLRGAPGETRTLDVVHEAQPLQRVVEVDRLLAPLE